VESLGWGKDNDELSTQRVTSADLDAGRIRIPRGPKKVFPPDKGHVEIDLRGQMLTCRWDPRLGPPERSGVISLGKRNLGAVKPDEVLSIEVGETAIRLT